MSWDSWLKTWEIHSRSRGFLARVDRAIEVARNGARHGKLVCSLSGGKDSVAMAGIVEEAGLADRVPCVHATSALSFPDTLATVEATVEKLNMELEVIAPDNLDYHVKRIAKKYGAIPPQPAVNGYDEWDLLRAVPSDIDIVDALNDVWRAIAAGNMLVAYIYERELAGSYVGLRADESRGRKVYARVWGNEHEYADGTHQVCPLLPWSGMDVYAYIVSRGLPIHPYYRAAFESQLGGDDPSRLRVDLAIAPSVPAALGAIALFRRVYPEMFRQLAAIRPELRMYT